ncbi:hypothetical protein I6N95_22740 [Vagococcus sp. BWB3-3]|uniref:Uncharacterized protein n=1 Tax=Vagococcus allomyrinae TaxID=2794353 RepID=A0A940PHU0_9ENTE|nr:hypothetical protein [Vagococcus allomyrinae]MBP1043851.1 hypothetical protein [Vagococcus allomyrinae]
METTDWLVTELLDLASSSRDYKQKALFFSVVELVKEQAHRQEQLAGELDGSLWSPNKW